jgi:hypothetical protein
MRPSAATPIYWFLTIDTGVLFVCNSFTLQETELPFRNPRVWKSLEMVYGDKIASFKPISDVQLVVKHSPGCTSKHMQPLTLDHELQPMLSQNFGLNASDEDLTEEQEKKVMATGWRYRSATGHTKPDFSGQPVFETKPEAEPQVAPLNFDGEAGVDAAAQEELTMAVLMFEVDRVYAPPSTPVWSLTDDEGETIAYYSDTQLGSSEPSPANYTLFVEVSFVGYGK